MTSLMPLDELAALRRLQSWPGLSRISEALQRVAGEPNFFATMPGIFHAEGVHSDMLAWLLTPREWHGLGDKFATALIHHVFTKCGLPCAEVVTVVRVYREYSTGKGQIDILVEGTQDGAKFILGIENKIWSPESEAQVFKYCEGLRSPERGLEGALILALLAPEERDVRRKPDCTFTTLTYRSVVTLVAQAVSRSLEQPADALVSTGRMLAGHYAGALRNYIMRESNPEIDKLCLELIEQHQRAWRAIRRRLPSERDDYHDHLAVAVCKRLSEAPGGRWTHVVRRDLYARVFRVQWLRLGSMQVQPPLGLSTGNEQCSYPPLHFRLVAESEETDVEMHFRYVLRLKGPDPSASAESAAVASAIRALDEEVPRDKQYTIGVTSTSTLPPIGEDGDVPDDVASWFVRKMAKYIAAGDGVMAPSTLRPDQPRLRGA
jgi:PD-(D/E)XK nuclease superfamily